MNDVLEIEDQSEFVEVDPTGRYGRYNEILGKGASKTVYRAFDEYEGIEVAWNQVKLYDFLQSPEDLERLYCEIHLLKTLKHANIMKFYTSWVDTANRNINFVTEMFTSGTLRQYRQKHKRVNIRAIKHWCRQILKGLLYLHNHDPPVIHRDLKCDNIFVNGNQGEVKIGDLGLAAILRKSHAARCVGTPEFMAPEVYAEEYNELVDIYAFGMCILEMVTFEYPYSECTHPAQIYKKVISGKKPDALYKVQDPEIREFVEKCLVSVTHRLPARELLKDPFLQDDENGFDLRPLHYWREFDGLGPIRRQPLLDSHHHSNGTFVNGYSNYNGYEQEHNLDFRAGFEANEIELFTSHEDHQLENVDISIKGRMSEDDGIFLRLRIADKEGRVRNIYFPFDIEVDTALSVATEMVSELDIANHDVTRIADMIDGEIACLVPDWTLGFGFEENPHYDKHEYEKNVNCEMCYSNGSLTDYISSSSTAAKNHHILQCPRHQGAAIHGRFEEITYQFDGSEQCVTEGAPVVSSQSDGIADIWAQHDGPELPSSEYQSCAEDDEPLEKTVVETEQEIEEIKNVDTEREASPTPRELAQDYENEIRQELNWLKTKYQLHLQELRDQRRGLAKSSSLNLHLNKKSHRRMSSNSFSLTEEQDEMLLKSFADGNHFEEGFSLDHMANANSSFSDKVVSESVQRAISLPVDAIN